jgi:hypothetical protein
MALQRCDAVVRTMNDSITTFPLQYRHGRRERKRPVIGAWSDTPSADQGVAEQSDIQKCLH